ncbi:MAG: agmatine deiminase family protein [Xanthomonadales bacterium PRO7]|jgi:agmatine/peptidylarginine deiminase|nr:agmatine deiminase family protein [Xanthomonadales bacterium PRO7]HMM56871.1 agmatine deiminase family protein [Rudaea sp.]
MTSAVFRLPAEWETQAGVLLAWPHAQTDWAQRLTDVEATFAALITAISRFESVMICVPDSDVRARAGRWLDCAGADSTRCRFVEIEYDDTWLRDSGPITLRGPDEFRLMDFRFTGWGGKFQASRDDRLIEGLAAREIFSNADHRRVDWALEGGAIESDGAGTILTTWRCLHQRHPEQSREQMSRLLCDKLGAQRVLWLERGYLQGDDTDAHIDTLARFAPDDAIVFQACDDASDPHHDELGAMRDELAALRTTDGRPYRLHALPWAKPIFDDGRRLAASYANYLIVNGAVLVPSYDDASDAQAARVVAQAHPGRAVIAVPCRSLIWQNGSLHCLTMQLPEGILA